MARTRSVKPMFWRDEKIVSLPRDARLMCIGMWNEADDYGRLLYSPSLIRGSVFPLDGDITDRKVAGWLDEMTEAGIICVYQGGSVPYCHFPAWRKHQHPSKPTPPVIPPCPTHGDDADSPRETQGSLGGNPAPKKEKEKEKEKSLSSGDEGVKEELRVSEEASLLCTYLADHIEANGSKRPTITKTWLTEADRLLRLDERDFDEAVQVLNWCQADDFWRSNILSMPKFRQQYDRLRLKASPPPAADGLKVLDPERDL